MRSSRVGLQPSRLSPNWLGRSFSSAPATGTRSGRARCRSYARLRRLTRASAQTCGEPASMAKRRRASIRPTPPRSSGSPLSRCSGRLVRRGCRRARPTVRSRPPTCARAPEPRTRRVWSAWLGGSSPPSASRISCCPPDVLEQLRELTVRARQRERVLGEWQMAGPASRRRGLTALFAGASGTGKTMAAEVVAGEMGLDLYVVDLASVVDKYVGRDREEPRPHLRRGGERQRGAAVRRGGCTIRQALGRVGRPRPIRERRGRLPAPAHGALRRDRDPRHQPAVKPRRGLRAPARLV